MEVVRVFGQVLLQQMGIGDVIMKIQFFLRVELYVLMDFGGLHIQCVIGLGFMLFKGGFF